MNKTKITKPAKIFDGHDRPALQGHWKDAGVVLDRKFTQGDGISACLFLKEKGLLWAAAPGAQKSLKRFSCGIEPLTWGNFYLYESAKKTYLKEINLTDSYANLREAPALLKEALFWCEVLKRILPPLVSSPEILKIFWNDFCILKELKKTKKNINTGNITLCRIRFFSRCLKSMGLSPSFEDGIPDYAKLSAALPRDLFVAWLDKNSPDDEEKKIEKNEKNNYGAFSQKLYELLPVA